MLVIYQEKLGLFRLCEVRPGYFKESHVRPGYVRLFQAKSA